MAKPEQPSVMLTVRVPSAVARAVDALADQEGVGRSDVVRALLTLGLRSPGSVEAEVELLRREVRALKESVDALAGKRR